MAAVSGNSNVLSASGISQFIDGKVDVQDIGPLAFAPSPECSWWPALGDTGQHLGKHLGGKHLGTLMGPQVLPILKKVDRSLGRFGLGFYRVSFVFGS